jgi:LPXTG-motif cell wall-anchored protein
MWIKVVVPVLGLLIAMSLSSSALAQQTISVTIGPGREEATGTGTATLTAMGNRTQVVLRVGTTNPDMPAHIHADPCPGVGDVIFPLTNVRNGTSTTMIDAPLADVLARGKSINLHRSASEIGVYVGCGNIVAAAAAAQVPGGLPRTGDLADIGLLAAALGAGLFGAGYVLRRRR